MANNQGNATSKTKDNRPSFAFEQVAAKLEPFDLLNIALSSGSNKVEEALERSRLTGSNDPVAMSAAVSAEKEDQQRTSKDEHALFPIIATNGLVFPYNPSITENLSVKYDAIDLIHANESVNVYKSTDNPRINLSDCHWTCDTFDNAIYALSVVHFLRSYSQMDFGRGRTGRPPSPMWFSAYGDYLYHRVPVLLEKADFSFPPDVDYVGIPQFGSPEYIARRLKKRRDNTTNYTWMPMKFTVSSISLVVQHSLTYWTTYSLDDYRSGAMLRNRNSFHALPGPSNNALKRTN